MIRVRTIQVFCRKCQTKLLTYRKGGSGSLVKCFLHKIEDNFTVKPGYCQNCGSQFARQAVIKNFDALKIVGGKVYWK